MSTDGGSGAEDRRDLDEEADAERRKAIEPLDIGELRTEPALERIARAVTELCDVSMAHVSIMEDETQCVVGQVGFDRDHFARDQSFCAYTLASRELMVVEDAERDDRFRENPYVTEAPHIRFYAGFPLEVQQIPVGTLCAIDDEPGTLGERCRASLTELARLTEQFLETKLVATSENDPRHRVAAELTSICGLTAILDGRADPGTPVGDLVGELKSCVEAAQAAVNDWIEDEHESDR